MNKLRESFINGLIYISNDCLQNQDAYNLIKIVNIIRSNPEILNSSDPKVKAYFNTLHEKGGPEMSGDPLISSAFVKQQLELPPQFLLEQVHKLVQTNANIAKTRPNAKVQLGDLD